jgi:hypothetical protein
MLGTGHNFVRIIRHTVRTLKTKDHRIRESANQKKIFTKRFIDTPHRGSRSMPKTRANVHCEPVPRISWAVTLPIISITSSSHVEGAASCTGKTVVPGKRPCSWIASIPRITWIRSRVWFASWMASADWFRMIMRKEPGWWARNWAVRSDRLSTCCNSSAQSSRLRAELRQKKSISNSINHLDNQFFLDAFTHFVAKSGTGSFHDRFSFCLRILSQNPTNGIHSALLDILAVASRDDLMNSLDLVSELLRIVRLSAILDSLWTELYSDYVRLTNVSDENEQPFDCFSDSPAEPNVNGLCGLRNLGTTC